MDGSSLDRFLVVTQQQQHLPLPEQRRREAKIAQAKKDKANALRKLRRQMEKVVGGNKQ